MVVIWNEVIILDIICILKVKLSRVGGESNLLKDKVLLFSVLK